MTAFIAGSEYAGVLAFSVAHAARAMGVSRATLYVLFAQRRLKYLKVGKRRLVERAEIDRFIASHRMEG
jgi:excisionase family DNA binding protein